MDTSQIDAQLSAIESRIAAIQGQARSASQAASSAASAMASAGGGSSGGGMFSGLGGFFEDLGGRIGGVDLSGFGTLPGSVSRATNKNSASGSGWSFGEDLGATLRLLGGRGKGAFGNIAGEASTAIGDALMEGSARGVGEAKGKLADSMRAAIDEAIKAGQDEAEIRSPSARAARELGSPIMTGITTEIQSGGASVANALTNTLDFAFQSTFNNMLGGKFGNSGSTVVANSGGAFSGIPDYIDQFGQAVNASFAIGNAQSGTQASRIFASNLPTQVRDFGQNLLSGVVSSILPGFASGPVSDLIGTAIGTKPILTAEQALSSAVSADAGGLSDSPFSGGQFVFNNNFSGGNFTDVEREVQLGIQQSMRRLGVAY